MLKTARISRTAASDRLIQLWADRYRPDLSSTGIEQSSDMMVELIEAATETGRQKTVDRVRRLIRLNCEMASLETNALFTYIPNIVNLAESRKLAKQVAVVYTNVLDIYATQQPPSRYLKFMDSSKNLFAKLALPSLMLPTITRLADELSPVLVELQNYHRSTQDPRSLGFLTTHFHFTTREILKQLNPSEIVLLTPYLKFVEEQVCIPWQRICAAAASHLSSSTLYRAVEQLLPQSREIASATYDHAIQQYGGYRSRRGRLTDAAIRVSTLRDLTMIQGYLHLCVLEGSLSAITDELLPLCVMVFPSIDVKWDLVETMLGLLMEELLSRAKFEQKRLLIPYTQSLQKIFAEASVQPCKV